jgi:hypothetical protein
MVFLKKEKFYQKNNQNIDEKLKNHQKRDKFFNLRKISAT